MRKLLIVVLVFALVAVIGSQREVAAKKFRIGYHAAFAGVVDVVAWKKGWFDELLGKGNYVMKEFPQGKLMRNAVLARSLDLGQAAARPYVGLVGKGSTSAVAIGNQSYWCGVNTVMVRPDSGITSLKELKGKKLICGTGTSSYYGFTHFILPQYGLTQKDYKAINATTVDRIPALVAKTVDFAIVVEPQGAIAEANGLAVRLKGLDWCKYDDPPFPLIADPRQLAARPKMFENYLRAWLRAAKLFKTDFDEFARIYHKHMISKGKKVELSVIKESISILRMHPQIDERFYSYVEKMNKVLVADKKTDKIADFRGGAGVNYAPMKAAIKAENYQ